MDGWIHECACMYVIDSYSLRIILRDHGVATVLKLALILTKSVIIFPN